MTKPTPAYSKTDIDLWTRNMQTMVPPRFVAPAFVNVTDVGSFALGHEPNGLHILIQPTFGHVPLNIFFNPVAACALMDGIPVSGKAGGWIGRDGRLVMPTRHV